MDDAPVKVADPAHLHYLPHHAVVHHDKDMTKLHVVYDASAKGGGKASLNDCLLIRPKVNQTALTALTANIEKALLMISVVEDDQEDHPFLMGE